jgi:hypothetical protein
MKEKGVTDQVLERIKARALENIDELGVDPDKVSAIIDEKGITIFAGKMVKSAEGFDHLDGIMDILAASRGRAGKPLTPFEEFEKAVHDAAAADDAGRKTPAEDEPISCMIVAAASYTAVELIGWVKDHSVPAPVTAVKALATMIDTLKEKHPSRFSSLRHYLSPYLVNLERLSEQLKAFAGDPNVEAGSSLANELARVFPVMINVLKEAATKARKFRDAAMRI